MNNPTSQESSHNPSQTVEAKKQKFVGWVPMIISVAALSVSFFSLGYNLGYIRPHEDHDVVGRLIGMRVITNGISANPTNRQLVADIALINRGNQTEIIRNAFLGYCYSDHNHNFSDERMIKRNQNQQLNMQLAKGDRQVLHISTPLDFASRGAELMISVGVVAIGSNADDIETVWSASDITVTMDGAAAMLFAGKEIAPLVQIVSNERLPHQKIVKDELEIIDLNNAPVNSKRRGR